MSACTCDGCRALIGVLVDLVAQADEAVEAGANAIALTTLDQARDAMVMHGPCAICRCKATDGAA